MESTPSGIQSSLASDDTVLAEHPVPDAVRPLARFYMTSDLRAATGLTRTHLDFYLREGIIIPTARTESGYLLFDDRELSTLRQVIAWRQDGVGIRDIRMRLARSEDAEITALPTD
ncbi:MAG: MerR family transcriptional regulator [Thermomicrobiales bacterium]